MSRPIKFYLKRFFGGLLLYVATRGVTKAYKLDDKLANVLTIHTAWVTWILPFAVVGVALFYWPKLEALYTRSSKEFLLLTSITLFLFCIYGAPYGAQLWLLSQNANDAKQAAEDNLSKVQKLADQYSKQITDLSTTDTNEMNTIKQECEASKNEYFREYFATQPTAAVRMHGENNSNTLSDAYVDTCGKDVGVDMGGNGNRNTVYGSTFSGKRCAPGQPKANQPKQ